MKTLKNITFIIAAIICICCITTSALAYTIQGTIIYVYDGDTVLLNENSQANGFARTYRIRLASIDAPETDQPYGPEATQLLRKLVYNKTVLANIIDSDKYGRKIGYIFLPDKTIHSEQANPDTRNLARTNPHLFPVNCYLLTAGAAWHYKAFDKTNAQYDLHYALEQQARTAKRGLWAMPNPIAPWLWRKRTAA